VIDHEHVQQIEARFKDMNKDGNKKILLDLRDVSAGDMAEAVRLTNFFVRHGNDCDARGQKFPKQIFSADPSKALNTTAPLVVLVNHGTSGPAELVAGALQDDVAALNWSGRRPSVKARCRRPSTCPTVERSSCRSRSMRRHRASSLRTMP
jgi:carboxyl-terminal processing protease